MLGQLSRAGTCSLPGPLISEHDPGVPAGLSCFLSCVEQGTRLLLL